MTCSRCLTDRIGGPRKAEFWVFRDNAISASCGLCVVTAVTILPNLRFKAMKRVKRA